MQYYLYAVIALTLSLVIICSDTRMHAVTRLGWEQVYILTS